MKRRILSCLIFMALLLSACGTQPDSVQEKRPLVPLPTYGTGRPPATTLPQNTRAPSPTADPNFWSNGSIISGWWWIRDDAHQNTANWIVDIPAGTGNINLNLTVLATEKADGGRGANALFFLSFGLPGSGNMGGVLYGRKMIALPNTSPASDPLGYTCTGTLTLTRAEIKNATRLWLKASRSDDLGEFPPSTVHLAFNKQSIVIVK